MIEYSYMLPHLLQDQYIVIHYHTASSLVKNSIFLDNGTFEGRGDQIKNPSWKVSSGAISHVNLKCFQDGGRHTSHPNVIFPLEPDVHFIYELRTIHQAPQYFPSDFSLWFFQFIWHVEKKNHFNCNRWIWVQLMHLWSWQYIFFLQMTSACQNIHGLVLPGFGAYPSSHIQVCDIHSDPSDNHWGIFNIMKEHSKVIIEKYFIFKTFQIYRFLSSKFQNACRFIESIYKCKNR